MRSRLLAIVVAVTALVGCAPHRQLPLLDFDTAFADRLAHCDASTEERWVACELGAMSLRDKAAQMVWPSLLGDYVAEDAPQWRGIERSVRHDHVGGVLISVGSPLEIAAKLNALQGLSPTPLLVGADLEFGAGYRARGGYFPSGKGIDLGGAVLFPPEMAVGATRDTALAYAQGRITAIEGRAIGIHVAFAPILDVNNNPDNPVINTRSYSADPQLASRLGAAFIRGLQEHGMVATGKHFPGHGDTGVNSHLGLPVVNASRARLDSVELVPFRAAIAAGVGAMMTFHGVMPALDSSGVPGTLSAAVLGGLLRGEMGFHGLIVSDAMDMRGVLNRFGAVEAAKRAVTAGADVLIQPLQAAETIDAVVAGIGEGRYDEARLDGSLRRLLGAKYRLGLARRRVVGLDAIRRLVDDSANRSAARAVAERSITLVRDSTGAVPLRGLSRQARVLSITFARRQDLAAGVTFDAALQRSFDTFRSEFVNADDAALNFSRLSAAADSVDLLIIGSYVAHAWYAESVHAPVAFADFVRDLVARGRHPIVIAFGNPYLLQQIPQVPTYLVAWSGIAGSQEAAARALLGLAPITGRLPIDIPPIAPFGAGETRPALITGQH
ncbi:MAG: hypothetical protein NVS4B3_01430 [Gemmatimonadaceae bacterium]